MKFKEYFISRRPIFSYTKDFSMGDSIETLLNNQAILEAIYIASPDFYEVIQKYKNGSLKTQKEIDDLFYSFNNYLLRMSTNPVPFGLFSSIGVHNYDQSSRIDDIWRFFDLDGTVFLQICELLHTYDEILPTFILGRNSSWNQIDDTKIKYSEKRLKNNLFEIELASIEKNDFLDELILRLNNGNKISIDQAIEIGSSLEYSEIDVKTYVAQLVRNNFLTTQLTPNSIEFEPKYTILSKITKPLLGSKLEDDKIRTISEICEIIESCNQSKNNNLPELIRITDLVKNLGIEVSSIKSPLLVNTYNTKELSCNKNSILESVAGSIELLLSLFDSSLIHDSKMSEFEERFQERYFDDCVKLEDALDPVHGIGYPINENRRVINPLVKGMPANFKTTKSNSKSSIDDFQLSLLKAVLQNNKNEEIKLDALDGINTYLNEKQLKYEATSSCIMLDVETEGEKEYYTLNHACFGSNTRLIGRFSSGSKDVENIIVELNKESIASDKDRILADFSFFQKPVHLNIGTSKSGLTHTIVHLNRGNDEQINLYPQDLYLRIINSKLALIDIKSGKTVDIFVGNATNPTKTLDPIARFLSDYQFYKRIPAVRFSLPSIMDSLPYVPRITFKGLILSPARWLITKTELDTLAKQRGVSIHELIKQHMLSLNVENGVYLEEEDERYRIEPYKDFGIRFILNKLNRNGKIILQESRISLSGNISQILLFGNREPLNKTQIDLSNKRVHFATVNQDILSVSIYLKEKNSDKALLAIADKIVAEFPQGKFFIVRYFDPMFHFRLRFVDWQNSVNINLVLTILNSFQTGKIISSYKIEPFKPELYRYGGDKLIGLSYKIFCDETSFILNELKLTNEVSLIAVLRRIHSYLNIYAKYADVLQLLEDGKNGFINEFQLTSKEGKKFLEKKFREHLPFLESIEKEPFEENGIYTTLNTYLNSIENNIEYTMSSLIHMFINRSVNSSQRHVETLVYYSLWRFYKMKFHLKK